MYLLQNVLSASIWLYTTHAAEPQILLSQAPADANLDALDIQASEDLTAAHYSREQDPEAGLQAAARAARTYAKLLAATTETADTSGWRQIRAEKLIKAYELAYELSKDCMYIQEALEAIDGYLGASSSSTSTEFIMSQRDELVSADCVKETEDAVAEVQTPVEPLDPPVVDSTPDPRADQPIASDKQFKVYRNLAITAGVFTGVSLGALLGTSLSRISEPFHGTAYKSILEAAEASFDDDDPTNNVDYDSNTDMCATARQPAGNTNVAAACQRWDRLGKAAIATGITTGIFATTTVVFAILAHRTKRKLAYAQGSRRLVVFAGYTPQRGVMVSGRMNF